MTECSACNMPKKLPESEKNIPSVIEIENAPEFVIFRKLVIPASMGDESQVPATAGLYRNVLLVYEANNHIYLYSSDGQPTRIMANISFNDVTDRPKYAGQTMTSTTSIPEVKDGSLVIKRNDIVLGEFSANTDASADVNISVPEYMTELVNDGNFVQDQAYVHTDANYTPEEKAKLFGLLEISEVGHNMVYDASTKTISAVDQEATLYDTTGQATDGAMTQKAVTDAIADKATVASLMAVQGQIPTAISQLTNDSSFVEDANYVHTDNNFDNSFATAIGNTNQNIEKDLTVSSDASTVTISENKINLFSNAQTTESLPLPVANAAQAGVMSASTYQAIQANADNINAILNGAVSVSGIAANPSQAALTTAWTTATGISTVINGAKINDPDNQKVWTYYTNTSTWYAASNTAQVVVNPATNTSLGIVKGKASGDGTIFMESDSTMSVNGWDTLVNTVNGKADSADVPVVNDGNLNIKLNGETTATFNANSASNVDVDLPMPIITVQTSDPGEGAPLAENHFIAVVEA